MRKGQEEIVGFVVVVIFVAIIALIFLGFTLRTPVETRQSIQVNQFLESALEYTSDCSLRTGQRARVGALFESCYQNDDCLEGPSACEVINTTIEEMIVVSLGIGEDRPYKGYKFSSKLINEGEDDETIVYLEGGNCTRSGLQGASDFRPSSGGVLRNSLTLCT